MSVVRQQAYKMFPRVGWYATADSVAAGYVADVSEFQDTMLDLEDSARLWIIRAATAAADRERRGTTIDPTLGRWSHGGPSYSDTTTLTYEQSGIRLTVWNNIIELAQRRAILKTDRALVKASPTATSYDLDMETSGVGAWDGTSHSSSTSSCTPTKSTTDSFSGTLSLLLTATGANGYVRGPAVRVNPAEQIYFPIIARADVGTLTYRLWDATNSAYINTANDIVYTGEEYAFFDRGPETLPAGCEFVQPHFLLTGATDIAVVDTMFGPYQNGARVFDLPSIVDEPSKLKLIRPCTFREPLGTANTYAAYSYEWDGDKEIGFDYSLSHYARDVLSNRIHMNKALPMRPIWLSIETFDWDAEPLNSETATTSLNLAPDGPLMPFVMHELMKVLHSLKPDDTEAAEQLAYWERMTAVVTVSRPKQIERVATYSRNLSRI